MKNCILAFIFVLGVVSLTDGNPVAPVKQDPVSTRPIHTEKHTNTFSPKRKKTNDFSYINAIAEKNGVNMKEFSYKNQNLINSLKTKLNSGNQDKLKFSYTEALKKYIQAHGKSQGTKQITSVANLMKILDVVKSDVGQPTVNKTMVAKSSLSLIQSPQPVKYFGNLQSGISYSNVASKQSGISYNNVASKQSGILYNNVASKQTVISPAEKTTGAPIPIQPSTTPTKTTTEQQETEAPDSEQTATTASSLVQEARCYCMEKCISSTVSEGQCGKPNSSGIRKSKCCNPKGGETSIEVGEAEEEFE